MTDLTSPFSVILSNGSDRIDVSRPTSLWAVGQPRTILTATFSCNSGCPAFNGGNKTDTFYLRRFSVTLRLFLIDNGVRSQEIFGFSKFRPYQKEIVEKILGGRDCLVVMATGSDKSLCYEVPPLVAKKTAVVISPLISLMLDQVMALKQRGIRAEYISSAQANPNVLRSAESGQYDILYVTPEKACGLTNSFWSRLLDSGICLLAVDEAHCISEWGHSFRVEYKQLDMLRDVLLNVPVVGLTTTATGKVRDDIMLSLKMHDPHIIIGSFDRQNLFYSVKSIDHCNTFLDDLVKKISSYIDNASSTIIYCTTVKDAIQIFESLDVAGIAAGL